MKPARLAALCSIVIAGCAAGPHVSPSAAERTPETMMAELAPFEQAFTSMQAALDARDDALARRILDQVRVRDPQGVALERADAFERILDGRALGAALGMQLSCTPGAKEDEFDLTFIAQPSIASEVLMRTAPASLRVLWIGIDPAGVEERLARSEPMPQLTELRFKPGETLRIALGEFQLPRGSALAVRASFELEFLSGEFVIADAKLPAARVRVQPAEAVRLAPFLPIAPVEPAELARYIGAGHFNTPALIERTVRIPRERRGEALDLLTPVALALESKELERLAPALRWLSGNSEIGAEAHAWRRWLDQRRTTREGLHRGPTLELPDRAP